MEPPNAKALAPTPTTLRERLEQIATPVFQNTRKVAEFKPLTATSLLLLPQFLDLFFVAGSFGFVA